MRKTKTKLTELKLIGITCRTNNQAEMNPASAKIGPTVQRYFHDGLATIIVNRKQSGVTYCVYTNYESDFTNNYTFFIGEQVTSFDDVPDSFEQLTVAAQDYVKFTTEPGAMPKICIDAWQNIWSMSPNELGGERSYIADFEVYDDRAQDPKNTILDIYIGIKHKSK